MALMAVLGKRTIGAVIVLLCWCACSADKYNSIPSTQALSFMRRFGYLEQGRPDSETLYTEEAVIDAIKLIQKFGAINQTGLLDEPTVKLMSARRCGCPDVLRERRTTGPARLGRRRRRYVIATPGWKKRRITYYIGNRTPNLKEEAVERALVQAFDAWKSYARLRFEKAYHPTEADIVIGFYTGSHGDWYAFDGPGGILAHAFYPYEEAGLGGDIHFDDNEQWAVNPNASQLDDGAIDLFRVAVHELGHSLGLGHSHVPDSVMFPYYQSSDSGYILGHDDIMAMYELYIKRPLEDDNETVDESAERTSTSTTTTTTTTTTTPSPPRRSRPPPHRPHATTQNPVTFQGDYETVEDHKKHDDKHRIPESPSVITPRPPTSRPHAPHAPHAPLAPLALEPLL